MPINLLDEFLQSFKKFWFLWSLCIVLNIITFFLVWFKLGFGNKTMALSYNVMVGVEWYGKGKNLYFIPAIGFLLSAINFVLYKVLRNSGEFLPFLAVFTAIFIQIILMISLLFLIRLN